MSDYQEDISLHPYDPKDDPFLLTLYASTRQDEMALVDWSPEEKEEFLRMQFQAQKKSYQEQAPKATWQIITKSNLPIGRLIVEKRKHEIGLMDISILPKYRDQGIGTKLIKEVMDQAEQLQKPVRLYVEKDNKGAMRLYQRLGFRLIGDTSMHHWMEWNPTKSY
ncbi:MAG: GNAT family N-acetyltransferase [Anaerolineales bacterium]|nr:MAG: GNAT family N-acetyltransferase [Anaerolineales bacterium]